MAKMVPETKKGPKGTSDFKVFLPEIINPTPMIAPIKKAKNKATRMFGNPKNKPIKIASLTSPKPIARPREIRNIARKNKAAPTADIRKSDFHWKSDFIKS